MKTSLALCGLASLLLVCAPLSLVAQTTSTGEEKVDTANLVSAGRITSVSEKNDGTVVIQPVGATPQLMFVGMARAKIQRANGNAATFADLEVNKNATVYYHQSGKQLLVARVIIANPAPVPPAVNDPGRVAPLTSSEVRALTSPAARDGDITTEPGTKARIDNDITTQPGNKARIDNDITTQPGETTPATRDITRKPADRPANRDGDITTREGNR